MQLRTCPTPPRSLLDLILRRRSNARILAELWNAAAEGELGTEVRDQIRARVSPEAWSAMAPARAGLLTSAVESALDDARLSDEELGFLRECALTFGVDGKDADSAYQAAAQKVYAECARSVGQRDAEWTPDHPELTSARANLRLRPDAARRAEVAAVIEGAEAQVLAADDANEQISELEDCIKSRLKTFGASIDQLDTWTLECLGEMRAREHLATGPLPEIEPEKHGVSYRGAACRALGWGEWTETRRAGPRQARYDAWTTLDAGPLVLTDDNLCVLSDTNTRCVRWDALASVERVSIGCLELRRKRGRTVRIVIGQAIEPELAGAIEVMARRLFSKGKPA